MISFKLTPSYFRLLKEIDLSEMSSSILLDENSCTVQTDDFGLLQIILSEEIDTKGMTPDQENVTPHGRELEALYDEILYQAAKQ